MKKNVVPSWASKLNIKIEKKDQEPLEKVESSEFQQLLDDNSPQDFQIGSIKKGIVVNITRDSVFVDLGLKQEGVISLEEFKTVEGKIDVSLKEEIEVLLERFDRHQGQLICSKEKAVFNKSWDKMNEYFEQKKVLTGIVAEVIPGGLMVDIEGVKAFLPSSQVDIRPVKNLKSYLGKAIECLILDFNKKKRNILLTRKAVVEEERNKLKSTTLDHLREGMVVEGIVKNILDYGAFIDLGGIDGLLHVTDLSWQKIKHPSDLLQEGQKLAVKILNFDLENEKISLGLKQLQEDPWLNQLKTFKVNQEVIGTITSKKDYGLFVELVPGLEGLIHVSELDWSSKKRISAKDYKIGDQIQVVITEIQPEEKRISLSHKKTLPNPWDELNLKHPVGSKIKGRITSILDFGLFLDVGEFVDAFIHVTDISWLKKNIQPQKEFQVGQELEAVVLMISKEKEKFSLGLKQMEGDPWLDFQAKYPVGSIFQGKVSNLTDFGAFIELEPGVEGLVHVSEMSEERVDKPQDLLKVGDEVQVIILSFNKDSKKISLSMKKANENYSQKIVQEAPKNDNRFMEQLKNFHLKKS